MNIQMDAIYQASYLNMMSAIMKELKLGELVDRLVPVDAQCRMWRYPYMVFYLLNKPLMELSVLYGRN